MRSGFNSPTAHNFMLAPLRAFLLFFFCFFFSLSLSHAAVFRHHSSPFLRHEPHAACRSPPLAVAFLSLVPLLFRFPILFSLSAFRVSRFARARLTSLHTVVETADFMLTLLASHPPMRPASGRAVAAARNSFFAPRLPRVCMPRWWPLLVKTNVCVCVFLGGVCLAAGLMV